MSYKKVGVSLYDTLGKDSVGELSSIALGSPLTFTQNTCSSTSDFSCAHSDQVVYRINHAELTIIFSTMDHIPSLLKMASKTPLLKLIVSIDALSPEISKVFTEWGQTHNIVVKDLYESRCSRLPFSARLLTVF